MSARRLAVLALVLAAPALPAAAGSAASPPPALTFHVFAATGLPLGDITWTGRRFVYTTETIGEVATSGPKGSPVEHFATLPKEVEEVRCRPSPGKHGWAPGDVYCNSPHGTIWRLAPDGSTSVFATLPDTKVQDGSLAFDSFGGFGYAMLAASGGSTSNGGSVFAVSPAGAIRTVGTYPGPGGADNIVLAPAQFGKASKHLLLSIDSDASGTGSVLAMAPSGAVRTLLLIPEGINPIAVIGRGDAPRGAASPGLYLADTTSQNAWFVPAAQLKAYAGAVIVGAEKTAHLWIVRPSQSGAGFSRLRVPSNLDATSTWNLEGAAYVA